MVVISVVISVVELLIIGLLQRATDGLARADCQAQSGFDKNEYHYERLSQTDGSVSNQQPLGDRVEARGSWMGNPRVELDTTGRTRIHGIKAPAQCGDQTVPQVKSRSAAAAARRSWMEHATARQNQQAGESWMVGDSPLEFEPMRQPRKAQIHGPSRPARSSDPSSGQTAARSDPQMHKSALERQARRSQRK